MCHFLCPGIRKTANDGIAVTLSNHTDTIIELAPIGVVALMLPVASRTGIAAAGALGYYVVVTAVAQGLIILLLYPVAALVGRVPMSRFAQAVFPAQAVAFSSSSSL